MLGPAGWERYQALSSRDPSSPYGLVYDPTTKDYPYTGGYDRWLWEQTQGRQNPPSPPSFEEEVESKRQQVLREFRTLYPNADTTDDEIWTGWLGSQGFPTPGPPSTLTPEEQGKAERIAAGLAPRATAPPSAFDRMATLFDMKLAQDRQKLARDQFNAEYNDLNAWQQAQVDQAAQQLAFQREQEERQYTDLTAYQGAQLGQQQAEAAQRMQLAQQQMAFEAQQAELARQQRQREMAQQIGQAIAAMQAELYQQTLPYRLPEGTQYAPGFEAGGPVSALYGYAGLPYQPTQVPVSNPPSTSAMQDWIADAMRRFGPG